MSLIQEGATIVGDLVTQPIQRFLVEKLTGDRYRIKRDTLITTDIHPTKPRIINKKHVSWNLEKIKD